MATEVSFQYQPLTADDSFRLVVLQPGNKGDNINCHLVHTRHCERPLYEALSYTWGSIENPKEAYTNGELMTIRQNLWDALQHLRYQHEQRVLWIDAICIDQHNIAERNHQVGQMRSIYSRAEEVIVWLGVETEGSQLAMQWIEGMGASHQRSSLGLRGRLSCLSPARVIQGQIDNWQFLEELCTREYWKRVWIVQEVVLAHKIRVYCGDDEAGWEGFENIIKEYDTIFKPKAAVKSARQVRKSLPAQLYHLRLLHKDSGCSLLKLLKTTEESLCSDPRDKVYALLGLAADCPRRNLVADYSTGLTEMYTALWKFYVTDGRPDTYVAGSQLFQQTLTSSKMRSQAENCIPAKVITIVGRSVGDVIYVGQPWKDSHKAQEWNNVLKSLEHHNGTASKQYRRFCKMLEEMTSSDLARVAVLGDLSANELNRRASQFEHHLSRNTSESQILGGEPKQEPAIPLQFAFWEEQWLKQHDCYKGYSVFVGQNGQMGIAAEGVIVGDKICQFRDSDVTVIVRRGGLDSDAISLKLVGKALLARKWDEEARTIGRGSLEIFKYGVLEEGLAERLLPRRKKFSLAEDKGDKDIVIIHMSGARLRWLTRWD